MPDEWHCSVPGWPASASAPALQVLAIKHDEAPGLSPEVARQAARQRVREVLAQHAGAEVLSHLRTSYRQSPAPGPVAVSHGEGLSLLAWCAEGCLGIDLVDLAPLEAMPRDERVALASLYLGEALDEVIPLAHAWARHEARLKCLGIGLTEWSADLQAALSVCPVWPVTLPSALADDGPSRWAGWLAWRPA